jgi:anti-sigma regulatory factor (Ser/Thr protein kinase)
MRGQTACAIAEDSAVGAARRLATQIATKAGLSETETGKVQIVVTELGRNVCRHAGHGTLFLQGVHDGGATGVEVLAVDGGPGMSSVEKALRDGYSTKQSAGTGLGAVQRLSTAFDVYSRPGMGTIVLSRILGPAGSSSGTHSMGAVSTTAPDETTCGDCWRLVQRNGDFALIVADGLGHGPAAGAAADRAVSVFEAQPFAPVREYFDQAHRAMHGTRGAAVAVAQYLEGSDSLAHAGVGNIVSTILRREGRSQGLVSSNGTVGAHMRQVQTTTCGWGVGDLLLMYTDGLRSSLSLEGYPGLLSRHPAIVGAVVHRDFQRGADDATIVVLRREV